MKRFLFSSVMLSVVLATFCWAGGKKEPKEPVHEAPAQPTRLPASEPVQQPKQEKPEETGERGTVLLESDFLSQNKIDEVPKFDMAELRKNLVYPRIALEDKIEGRVILELWIDDKGNIRNFRVLKEDPEGYGFADAAKYAFKGVEIVPAKSNGQPVYVRYRWPFSFTLRK